MIRTIATDELESMRRGNADFLLLDVLSTEHFRDDHIEGAHNVPLTSPDFLQAVERAAGSKSRRIVVYCADEACDAAERAARRLADAGYADVMTFLGGIHAWRQHGGAQEASGPTTAGRAAANSAVAVDRAAPRTAESDADSDTRA